MSDIETVEERLRAVERTLTESEDVPTEIADHADLTNRTDELDASVADLAERVDELEAAVQALRGYVGNVRSVNREVERRADAALATAERLADELDEASAHDASPGSGDSAEAIRSVEADGRSYGNRPAEPGERRNDGERRQPETDESDEPGTAFLGRFGEIL